MRKSVAGPDQSYLSCSTSRRKTRSKEHNKQITKALSILHKPVQRVQQHGFESFNSTTSIDFITDSIGKVSQIIQPKNKEHIPSLDINKNTPKKFEYIKSVDFNTDDRYKFVNKPRNTNEKRAPNIGKGPLRTSYFEEASRPKWSVHHYVHDPKYDLIDNAQGKTQISIETKEGFKTSRNPDR